MTGNKAHSKTYWQAIAAIVIALLFFSTMFLNVTIFVEAHLVSKWYALIAGAVVCTGLLLFEKRRLEIDGLSIILFLFIGYLLARGLASDMPAIKALLFSSFILLTGSFGT